MMDGKQRSRAYQSVAVADCDLELCGSLSFRIDPRSHVAPAQHGSKIRVCASGHADIPIDRAGRVVDECPFSAVRPLVRPLGRMHERGCSDVNPFDLSGVGLCRGVPAGNSAFKVPENLGGDGTDRIMGSDVIQQKCAGDGAAAQVRPPDIYAHACDGDRIVEYATGHRERARHHHAECPPLSIPCNCGRRRHLKNFSVPVLHDETERVGIAGSIDTEHDAVDPA